MFSRAYHLYIQKPKLEELKEFLKERDNVKSKIFEMLNNEYVICLSVSKRNKKLLDAFFAVFRRFGCSVINFSEISR